MHNRGSQSIKVKERVKEPVALCRFFHENRHLLGLLKQPEPVVLCFWKKKILPKTRNCQFFKNSKNPPTFPPGLVILLSNCVMW